MVVSLFHQCYYSYLKGDLESTRMFFDFLRDEFRRKKDKNALDKYQLSLLKKVKNALDTGVVSTKGWIQTDTPDTTSALKSDKNHQEVVEAICESYLDLKNVINKKSEEFHIYNLEHPCPPYGRADILCMDNAYAYPIEVKPGIGNHDIIGQISKYDLYCRFQLHKRFYSDVMPVTICGGYSKFVLEELKKLGVTTLIHRFVKDKLMFTKV